LLLLLEVVVAEARITCSLLITTHAFANGAARHRKDAAAGPCRECVARQTGNICKDNGRHREKWRRESSPRTCVHCQAPGHSIFRSAELPATTFVPSLRLLGISTYTEHRSLLQTYCDSVSSITRSLQARCILGRTPHPAIARLTSAGNCLDHCLAYTVELAISPFRTPLTANIHQGAHLPSSRPSHLHVTPTIYSHPPQCRRNAA
jgi:hypothetical protein